MRSALFICLGATLIAQNNTSDRSAAIAREQAEEVRRTTERVEQPAVQHYVAKLGTRLDADATFSVIKNSRAKGLQGPIAMPGGYIFVPASSLLAANDEAEFAGMLAQAIVRARKPIRPMTPGTIPLFFGTDSLDGGGALMSAQRHADELEADAIAVPLMSRAGFDPAALLRYVERRQPLDRPDAPFPIRADRIAGLQQAIRDLPPANYSESDEFHAI
jgi:predicted Zn-dependent protease